mmetsp:Transcript_597/g.930  ORF Transcript_597/g.930 Transcript_597/m.930 type:complete len:500 (+) Transcript_597:59-1558(+)
MKRSLNSDHSFGCSEMKRPHSSMFSIATVIEEAEINELKRVASDGHSRQISLTSTILGTETISSDDFFIEDEDCSNDSREDDRLPLSPFRTIVKVVPTEGTRICLDDEVPEEKEINDCKTGLTFEASLQHYDRHNRFHKERPHRVTSIQEALTKNGLVSRCELEDEHSPDLGSAEMKFLNDDDFLRVHLPGYMQRISKFSSCKCNDKLDCEAQQFKSIYLTSDSVQEAKNAAGSLCRLVDKVVSPDHDLENGFAIIRPPGHHAEPSLAGGYCIINNVAVAAAYARKVLDVKKILIVDWDVHHGNGTQSIFLNDPNVIYFSVHRWHGGNFFPFLQNGGPTNVGMGDGVGFNVNVGWSNKGMGDKEYFALWETLLLPLAQEFQPELVLVSAGFDAADGDMGECHVTPAGFRRLTQGLQTLDSKIVCSLEGGYVRSVLGKCVSEVVEALLDPTSPQQYINNMTAEQDELGSDAHILETIDRNAAKNIRATIAAHRPYWKCFQ